MRPARAIWRGFLDRACARRRAVAITGARRKAETPPKANSAICRARTRALSSLRRVLRVSRTAATEWSYGARMQPLTPNGEAAVQNLAQRYGVSVDAAKTLLFAVNA